MKAKEKSDVIVSWIGLIAVIVGGVLGFIEYFNQKEEARIKNTLMFLERSYKSPIKDAFKIVDRAWTAAIPTQNRIWDQDNKTQDEKENQWRAFVLSLNYDKKIATNTMTVINFYEEIGICVYSDICDRVVTFEIFGKLILTFYNQNYHYIMYLRQSMNNHRFAERMEMFVKSYINYQKESNRLEKNTEVKNPTWRTGRWGQKAQSAHFLVPVMTAALFRSLLPSRRETPMALCLMPLATSWAWWRRGWMRPAPVRSWGGVAQLV